MLTPSIQLQINFYKIPNKSTTTKLFHITRNNYLHLVSCVQTSFCTEGRGLGHGCRVLCCPAPWSAYLSQYSVTWCL